MEPLGQAEVITTKPDNDYLLPRPEDAETRRLQDKALGNLQKLGLLDIMKDANGEIDMVIFDPTILTSPSINTFNGEIPIKNLINTVAGPLILEKRPKNTREKIYWVFKGIPVVSVDEQKAAKAEGRSPKAKNLFYVPGESEIYDVESMRKAKETSHLTQWSVGSRVNWDKPLATRESDFGSGVPLIELAVPYEIYASANGRRDDNGRLWVDAVPGKSSEGRQLVSGKWFTDNFFTGGGKSKTITMESPVKFVEKWGLGWEATGILTAEDFDRSIRDRVVGDTGRVTIGGKRFSLGSEFAGSCVKKVGTNAYGVFSSSEDAEPIFIFGSRIKTESVRDCKVISSVDQDGYTRNIVDVPMGAFQTTLEETNKRLVLTRYEEGRRVRSSIDYIKAVGLARHFNDELGIDKAALLEGFSMEKQFALISLVGSLDKRSQKESLDFIRKGGSGAISILIDSYLEGKFSHDLFKVLDLPDDELKDILDKYESYSAAVSGLVDNIAESLDKIGSSDREKLLLERVRQSLVAKGVEIVASSVDAKDRELLINTLNKVAATCTVASRYLKGSDSDQYTRGTNIDGNLSSLTKTTHLAGKERFSVLIRPEAIPMVGDLKYDQGQARIGFSYTDVNGSKFNLRFDIDEYGLSVDIGTHKGEDAQLLTSHTTSHHVREFFDTAFNSKDFSMLANRLPMALEWKEKF